MQSRIHHKKIGSVSVAYRSIGTGHPVFCFPGWTLSSTSYLPLMNHLDTDLFRYILLDIPGWAGKSQKLKTKTTIHALAKVSLKFIESFGFGAFSLLGYSYGGALVQQIMKTKKLPVTNIILVSTFCEGGESLKQQFDKPIQMYAHAKKSGVSDAVIRKQISRIFNASVISRLSRSQYSKGSAMDKILEDYFSGDIRAMIESGFSALKHTYLSESLKTLPVLVLYAENDMPFIKSSSEKLAQFTKSRPVIVKGDHNHMLFDPSQSASHIRDFLE